MKKRIGFDKSWNANFAYTLGIIATDGNLSSDDRHINITSKDKEIIIYTKKTLSLKNKISMKGNGASKEKRYYFIQFGNVDLYKFLLEIGVKQRKSKTISKLKVPKEFFKDFLRGCIDGDGSITISRHPESKHDQLRIRLCSASLDFVIWIKSEIQKNLHITTGWIYTTKDRYMHTLSFGKRDSVSILKYIYHDAAKYFLKRKYKLAKKFI